MSRTIRSEPNRNGWGSKSITLEARLEILIVARCHEKDPRSPRVAELNAIFRSIYSDRRWRYRNDENRDYYEDALALMWRYLLLNLCEATTARTSGSFLETRTYAVGRLLTNRPRALLQERMIEPQLSDRDCLVLRLMAVGKNNQQIGTALGIAQSTVKFHVNNILGKLKVHDRTQAVITAYRRSIACL